MEGIVNFLNWIRADVVVPIAAALLGIGVAWFLGYKIGFSGLRKISALAEAQQVSIDTFRPQIIGYALALLGGLLFAALSAVIGTNFEAAKAFVNGILQEALRRSVWNGSSYPYLASIMMFNMRWVRRIFRNRLFSRHVVGKHP